MLLFGVEWRQNVRFFYVLYPDKTWVFDQSEHPQGPIYILMKYVEVNFWGISQPLQHSIFGYSTLIPKKMIPKEEVQVKKFTRQVPFKGSNHLTHQTVSQASASSCAIRIRPKCVCVPNYLTYFPSRLSKLTKTFST